MPPHPYGMSLLSGHACGCTASAASLAGSQSSPPATRARAEHGVSLGRVGHVGGTQSRQAALSSSMRCSSHVCDVTRFSGCGLLIGCALLVLCALPRTCKPRWLPGTPTRRSSCRPWKRCACSLARSIPPTRDTDGFACRFQKASESAATILLSGAGVPGALPGQEPGVLHRA